MQSGLRYRCCVDYVVEWMEHSSNLVVFCHTPSSMLTWSWLDSSDLYFFIRFNCGSKILLKSLILDQRSPTNYQWSNLQNPKPRFRKVTHCWRKDGTLDTTCVNVKMILFCQTPTRSQKRQRDPKSPTRPEVKICALQQQDVISLCSRQITVLLLAVVFINSRHWLLVLNLFIFFCLFRKQIHPLIEGWVHRGALMKIHSSLSDQLQSLAKVSLRFMISLVDRDTFAKYAALLIVGKHRENRTEECWSKRIAQRQWCQRWWCQGVDLIMNYSVQVGPI